MKKENPFITIALTEQLARDLLTILSFYTEAFFLLVGKDPTVRETVNNFCDDIYKSIIEPIQAKLFTVEWEREKENNDEA